MKKNSFKLDKYEQEIEASLEELVAVSKKTKSRVDNIVGKAKKSKSISLRFNAYDLEKVKAKAERTGLPYQTLITMVIHKYITGQYCDREEIINTFKAFPKSLLK